MAYVRGSTYIWSDGEHLHLWADNGLDHWQSTEYGDKPNASGVQIAETIADQFAVMRFAELVRTGKLDEAIDQAIAQGNFGSAALTEVAPLLKKLCAHPSAQ